MNKERKKAFLEHFDYLVSLSDTARCKHKEWQHIVQALMRLGNWKARPRGKRIDRIRREQIGNLTQCRIAENDYQEASDWYQDP